MADDTHATDALEILPVMLLTEHRDEVLRLRRLANTLRIGLGWHYLLDLTWILDQLRVPPGSTILDAGAGQGLLQWYLCQRGYRVISVDRASRSRLPVRLRCRYRVRGLRGNDDLMPFRGAVSHELRTDGLSPKGPARQVRNLGEVAWRFMGGRGEVVLYDADLSALPDVADNSVDAVVAVSALEHNPPDELPAVIDELMRVLKPGSSLIATLGAARDHDWFHEPSSGWCYTEQSMRSLFRIDSRTVSNYERYDELMDQLKSCEELRDNLAKFYFQAGNNGMPWGRWDPHYQPVGVLQVKRADD